MPDGLLILPQIAVFMLELIQALVRHQALQCDSHDPGCGAEGQNARLVGYGGAGEVGRWNRRRRGSAVVGSAGGGDGCQGGCRGGGEGARG